MASTDSKYPSKWTLLAKDQKFQELLKLVCEVTSCNVSVISESLCPLPLMIFKCICAYINLDKEYPHTVSACCSNSKTHTPKDDRVGLISFLDFYCVYIPNLNHQDEYGNSYLHYLVDVAIDPGMKSKIITKYIQKGAHLSPNNQQITPLLLAALKGDGSSVSTFFNISPKLSNAEIIIPSAIIMLATSFQNFHAECRKTFQKKIQENIAYFTANPNYFSDITLPPKVINSFQTLLNRLISKNYLNDLKDTRAAFDAQMTIILNVIKAPCAEVSSLLIREHELVTFSKIFPHLMHFYDSTGQSVRGACLTTVRPFILWYQDKLKSVIFSTAFIQPIDSLLFDQLNIHFPKSLQAWINNYIYILKTQMPSISEAASLFALQEIQISIEDHFRNAACFLELAIKLDNSAETITQKNIECRQVISYTLSNFYERLLNLNCKITDQVNDYMVKGFLPLHLLARIKSDTAGCPSSSVIKLLIEDVFESQKHTLNQYDVLNRTPLHWAIFNKSKAIKYFLEIGAYPFAVDKELKKPANHLIRETRELTHGEITALENACEAPARLITLSAMKISQYFTADMPVKHLPKDLALLVYMHQDCIASTSYKEINPLLLREDEAPKDLLVMLDMKGVMIDKKKMVFYL